MQKTKQRPTLEGLQFEMQQIKSALFGMIALRDPEGEYNPKFVKEVLAIAKLKPTHRYTGRSSFLKQVREA